MATTTVTAGTGLIIFVDNIWRTSGRGGSMPAWATTTYHDLATMTTRVQATCQTCKDSVTIAIPGPVDTASATQYIRCQCGTALLHVFGQNAVPGVIASNGTFESGKDEAFAAVSGI